MISLFSGTPGSGKSFHAVKQIRKKLMSNKKYKDKVISNFNLRINNALYTEKFFYKDNSEITIDFLMEYAFKYHQVGIEGQTLVVIDEAQILFNSRDWGTNSKKRMDWIKFFSQHRHFGFDFILIAQFDRMLDRQIRCLIEYDVSHHKLNNWLIILPVTAFVAVTKWYGQRIVLDREVIFYSKKIANLYNSYMIFDNKDKPEISGAPSQGEATEEQGSPAGEQMSSNESSPVFGG